MDMTAFISTSGAGLDILGGELWMFYCDLFVVFGWSQTQLETLFVEFENDQSNCTDCINGEMEI